MRWHTSEVLEIDDASTCAGFAHSQGRRCNNHLSSTKTEAALTLLDHMSCYAVSCDEIIHEYLEALAECLLCPQRHGTQAQSVIETWKRRILTFLRTQAVREIQELESTVEDLTERLEASRITVSQPSSSHNPPAVTILNTDDTLQPLEHSATLSATASSTSSGQGFTPVYNGTSRLSNVQYDDDNNLLWSRDRDPWFFEGASSSEQTPLPAVGRQAQDSNEKRKPPPEAKANCPICFDGMGSKDRVSRCHGCLEKFHESCINAWVKQCKEASTNATCPCCRLDWDE